MNKSLFLCGLMGSGKSFVGKQLAGSIKETFIDLDEKIEHDENCKISDIFTDKGESFFRQLELNHITSLLKENNTSVVALGGGAVCFNGIDKMIFNGASLVYLYSSPENIYDRIKDETHRPLLNDYNGNSLPKEKIIQKLEELLQKRSLYYENSHLQINVDELSPEEIISEIREFYERR